MSDEVSSFLRDVEQLKGRRTEEDEARSRELEEKILQERRERQARREERARSISPQKSSPANTPPPSAHRNRTSLHAALDGVNLDTFSSSSNMESPETSPRQAPAQSTADADADQSPFDSDSKQRTSMFSPTDPASPRTLSWQRRPPSRGAERPKSRPLSVVATENAAARSSSISSQAAADTPDSAAPSRDQIAQSLASKDPSWFRQTADRGQGSAALRRSQVEDDSDRTDMSAARMEMHGMVQPPLHHHQTMETQQQREEEEEEEGQEEQDHEGNKENKEEEKEEAQQPRQQQHPPTQAIHAKTVSPLVLGPAQRLDPPGTEASEDKDSHQNDRSPLTSPGRRSPTRPLSPTKGMGGFVQSAMMKRTDSVKRWSVSSPTGLQRADTVASNRASISEASRGGMHKSQSRPVSYHHSVSRPSSRPTSSHGKDAGPDDATMDNGAATHPPPEKTEEKQTPEDKTDNNNNNTTPPTSPSKTMDPRRWSPSKNSSWLEAALNKPDSPKPKPTPPPTSQPAWMVELNKAKAQKANNPGADISRTQSVKHEVVVGGLMRAPPMGTGVKPTPLPGKLHSPSLSQGGDRPLTPGLRNRFSNPAFAADGGQEQGSESPGRRIASPVLGKPKPETPPKKDFRATLKSFQPPSAGTVGGDTNELKSVFGTLRKTKTQNYVAPDTFKDNIMRGKEALNVTGGPKPSVRKDEFKDAILQKKAEFQKAKAEGRGVARSSAEPGEKQIPEGLAKALERGRSGTVTARKETAPPELGHERSVSTPGPLMVNKAIESPREEASSHAAPKPVVAAAVPKVGGRLADRFNPALAGLIARGRPGAGAPGSSSQPDSTSSTIESEERPAPGPQLTHITKGRARGPRRKAPTATGLQQAEAPEAGEKQDPSEAKPSGAKSPSPVQGQERARPLSRVGLRGLEDRVSLVDSSKRLATENQSPAPAGKVVPLVDSSVPRSPSRKIHEQVAALAARGRQNEAAADETTSQPSSPRKLDARRMSIFVDEASQKADGEQPLRPLSPQKTGRTPRPLSPQKTGGRFPEAEAPRALSPQKTGGGRQLGDVEAPRALSPQKTGGNQRWIHEAEAPRALSPQKTGGSQLPPVEIPRALSPQKTGGNRWLQDAEAPRPLSPQKTGGRQTAAAEPPRALSPQKTGGNRWLQDAEVPRALSPQKTGGSHLPPAAEAPRQLSPQRTGGRRVPFADEPKPLSPQKTGGRRFLDDMSQQPRVASPGQDDRSQPKMRPLPISLRDGPTSPQSVSPVRSPTKYASEIASELNEFFGRSRPKRDYSVDAAELLMRRPAEPAKVRTLSVQLFRIGADGKKQAVPAHQERMLFEREMYLCGHTFLDEAGRRTSEVYFWAGDEVPPSQIEDAQLFIGREARALGGKLIGFSQGKESPEFLQALGGVVIVRRGSSNKYDSLAPSMLCARRFRGQMTLDEVDFSPHSLCSGFPYLITQHGKCFLWKGKGSDVDELSCARLIGMDLALTGELIEVDDSNEPPEFWSIFGGELRAGSADHWRLKPNYEKYCGRLFRSDAGDRQQISEVFPFSQADLDPAGIYILDCFFEMYIVVGYGAQPQYASFRNALDFAQEYAILASSMEDRPFVPISTVVLEGIPRDLKSVFRKWRDAASPTRMNVGASNGNTPLNSPGLQRGRSLRIVPLNQALLALAD